MQLFGICQAPSLLMLVSEFMAGGTLADAIQSPDYRWYKRCAASPMMCDRSSLGYWQCSATQVFLQWTVFTVLKFMSASSPVGFRGRATLIQIVSGLLYLHQKSICHFDIKPANIMFDVDGVAKLCDAGLARILEASAISSSGPPLPLLLVAGHSCCRPDSLALPCVAVREGTLTYAAPETIMGQRTGPPADVFSLGVVMQELITGERLIRRGGSRAIRRVS